MELKLKFKLDEDFRNKLLKFVLNSYKIHTNGVFVGHKEHSNRNFCKLNSADLPEEISTAIEELRENTFNEFGIKTWKKNGDVLLFIGNFIEVITEGGFVNPHTDGSDPDFHHFRINFLIQKPIDGGMPCLDNIRVDLDEGESWINIASAWEHYSIPVVGNRERIVLSLGGLVPIDDDSVNAYL